MKRYSAFACLFMVMASTFMCTQARRHRPYRRSHHKPGIGFNIGVTPGNYPGYYYDPYQPYYPYYDGDPNFSFGITTPYGPGFGFSIPIDDDNDRW